MCAAERGVRRRGGLRLDGRVGTAGITGRPLLLAADYVHPFESLSGTRSRCRIRIYLPDEECDAPVVICSELLSNRGIPVTGAAENIAARVIAAHGLEAPVWIEHHPKETTVAGVEAFELVVFSDYKAREVVHFTGSRLEIGQPSWKPLDRWSVEVLIGQPLG